MRPEKQNFEQTSDTTGKTETFLTRNVRTITFLTCIAIFLAFFGPVSVFTVGKIIEHRVNQKKAMTVEETLKLAETPASVTFERLRKYEGKYNETDTAETYYIDFDRYLLLANQNKKTGKLTVWIEDLDSGVRVDLFKDDVKAFFDGTSSGEGDAA